MENVLSLSNEESTGPHVELDQCKERLGDIKNQLLESVKRRWIKSGRRNSMCSLGSTNSETDRDEDFSSDRRSWQKTATFNGQ